MKLTSPHIFTRPIVKTAMNSSNEMSSVDVYRISDIQVIISSSGMRNILEGITGAPYKSLRTRI